MSLLKLPPKKDNSSYFKSVPREFQFRKQMEEKSKVPPIGGYRTKRELVEIKKNSNVRYGDKKQWANLGQK